MSAAATGVALPAYPTKPGWYCIVFLDDYDEPQYGPLFRFDGQYWFDDDGDEVEHLFDAFLQMRVAMDAADGYVPQ